MKTGQITRESYLQPGIRSCELICCKATIFILQWWEKNKYIFIYKYYKNQINNHLKLQLKSITSADKN